MMMMIMVVMAHGDETYFKDEDDDKNCRDEDDEAEFEIMKMLNFKYFEDNDEYRDEANGKIVMIMRMKMIIQIMMMLNYQIVRLL
jgi:hypothetical protein